MFAVPVFLLAFDRAVAGIPTAVVHCLRLAVVALKQRKQHETSNVHKLPKTARLFSDNVYCYQRAGIWRWMKWDAAIG